MLGSRAWRRTRPSARSTLDHVTRPALTDRGVLGRDAEISVIETFIHDMGVRASALTLKGDAGIGKTTLWKLAVGAVEARGHAVLRCRGSQTERDLSFAAHGDLLERCDAHTLNAIPEPQRLALDVALHRAAPKPDPPDPLAVARAFRSSLEVVSGDHPVLIAIDDVHWMDRSSAFAVAFALRRMSEHRVGVLLSTRTDIESDSNADIQTALVEFSQTSLTLEPLSLGAMHHVLRNQLGTTFHRPTLVRIQLMSQGNPFFALEIGRAIVQAGFEDRPGQVPPVPTDLKQLLVKRLSSLSESTRDILLIFAAWSDATIDRVEKLSGSSIKAALDEALDAELIVLDKGTLSFTHPLLASTIYEEASGDSRRLVHERIAARASGLEERARHLARTVTEPSGSIAVVLDDAAGEARNRGATHTAADLYEQSVALTPPQDLAQRSARTLKVASCFMAAGDPKKAQTLLESTVATMPRNSTWGDAIVALAEACFLAGDPQAGIRHGEAALEELHGEPRSRGRSIPISRGSPKTSLLISRRHMHELPSKY